MVEFLGWYWQDGFCLAVIAEIKRSIQLLFGYVCMCIYIYIFIVPCSN
jgi:hypothetical protein